MDQDPIEPQTSLTSSSQVALHADVALRRFDDEAVLLHLGTGIYYAVGGAGSRMVETLRLDRSLEETAQELAAEFGERRASVLGDLVGFCDRLHRLDLLEVR